jgi:chromosome segregation ATPase
VCFVYLGAMAIMGLLSTLNQQNKQQLQTLELLVAKQEKQIETLEKELAKQKQDNQTMYNTFVYDSDNRERTLRGHGQQLTDHFNNMFRVLLDVQSNTATCANHSDILRRVIHTLHEQNKTLLGTQLNVDKHTQLIQQLREDVDNSAAHIDAVDESLTEFVDQITNEQDQFADSFEMKLQDAIDHFNATKDKLEDQLEEQENQLSTIQQSLDETYFGNVEEEENELEVKETLQPILQDM